MRYDRRRIPLNKISSSNGAAMQIVRKPQKLTDIISFISCSTFAGIGIRLDK